MSNEEKWKEIPTEEFFSISLDGVTVRGEWPGAENVRVMVREEEEGLPTLQLYDGIFVNGVNNQGAKVYGPYVLIGDRQDGFYTIVNGGGVQHCVNWSYILYVFRNGTRIYPSTP